ncbi:MAG TPA: rRNA maturation RNase YbeY [Jatrophihabitantaceae bacterium]
MSVEINNESGVAVDERALADLGRYVLDAMRVSPLADLSVVLLDAEAMSALHLQWMDLDGPTDVMAFPMDGTDELLERADHPGSLSDERPAPAAMLGDVVLCPEVAAVQAREAGHSLEAELHLLCTHGILHLLGYDHGDAEEEQAMFELQARIVRGWAAMTGRGPIRAPLPGTGGEVRDSGGRR